jgi:hypothetical protein
MKTTSRDFTMTPRLRLSALALASTLALVACGGGGGSPGTTGGTGSGSTGGTGGSTVTVGAPASVQFVSAVPSDKSIVIKGQGGSGRTETATLTFKVVDTFGNALAGQTVNFTTTSTDVTLNTTSGKTDASGTVVTTVNSGTKPATFRVQATLPGTATTGTANLSTLSDSIVVTTGLPTQRSFSISTNIYNPEGWTFDSSPTSPAAVIQVLLADAFGNPVPDGTPIIFQTNAGSVGSSSAGACNTVNGGCSVDYRAQNPRVPTPGLPATPCNTTGTDGKGAGAKPDIDRPGVATVCASSTDGTTTLLDSIPIFLSGSDVRSVYLNSVNHPLDFTNGVDLTTELKLAKVAVGVPVTFSIQLNDVNLNPMPAGSTVTVINPVNATASTPMPATVSNAALNSIFTMDPSGALGYSQGTWHQLTITPTGTGSCANGTADISFYVSVTTPGTTASAATGATTTTIPFKMSVSCP